MKIAFALALTTLASVISPPSHARHPDETYTLVRCHQPGIADAGVMIEIQAGGIAGMTMAYVFEQSIMGPREVGMTIVHNESINHAGKPTVFSGNNFELVIHRQSSLFNAHFTAEIGGHSYNEALSCTRGVRAQ